MIYQERTETKTQIKEKMIEIKFNFLRKEGKELKFGPAKEGN